MLYLQAIEVQCLLEGLLGRKEKEEEEDDSVSMPFGRNLVNGEYI